MTENERWDLLVSLDDELLDGAVALSEWSVFLVRDADRAFATGAFLSAILTALAGIESHLKYEYGKGRRVRLIDLIDAATFPEELKRELHQLRRYRNSWVHIDDPGDDRRLLDDHVGTEAEIEQVALRAARILRRVLYNEQAI